MVCSAGSSAPARWRGDPPLVVGRCDSQCATQDDGATENDTHRFSHTPTQTVTRPSPDRHQTVTRPSPELSPHTTHAPRRERAQASSSTDALREPMSAHSGSTHTLITHYSQGEPHYLRRILARSTLVTLVRPSTVRVRAVSLSRGRLADTVHVQAITRGLLAMRDTKCGSTATPAGRRAYPTSCQPLRVSPRAS